MNSPLNLDPCDRFKGERDGFMSAAEATSHYFFLIPAKNSIPTTVWNQFAWKSPRFFLTFSSTSLQNLKQIVQQEMAKPAATSILRLILMNSITPVLETKITQKLATQFEQILHSRFKKVSSLSQNRIFTNRVKDSKITKNGNFFFLCDLHFILFGQCCFLRGIVLLALGGQGLVSVCGGSGIANDDNVLESNCRTFAVEKNESRTGGVCG